MPAQCVYHSSYNSSHYTSNVAICKTNLMAQSLGSFFLSFLLGHKIIQISYLLGLFLSLNHCVPNKEFLLQSSTLAYLTNTIQLCPTLAQQKCSVFIFRAGHLPANSSYLVCFSTFISAGLLPVVSSYLMCLDWQMRHHQIRYRLRQAHSAGGGGCIHQTTGRRARPTSLSGGEYCSSSMGTPTCRLGSRVKSPLKAHSSSTRLRYSPIHTWVP